MVSRLEAATYPNLSQPLYSEGEDQVAYLSQPHGSQIWEVWVVSNLNEESRRLASLDPGEWKLEGWFDNDKRLLLSPLQSDAPRVVMVDVASGSQKEFKFSGKTNRFVGVQGGQLFFQRYDHGDPDNPDELASALTLLDWAPGDERLNEILSIPFEMEKLSVEGAWPSLNGRWLALDIAMGESGRERALWLYDREVRQLDWTGIRLDCQAIRVAWSPDSSSLVAAVESTQGCELYAFWNIHEGQFVRLSAGGQHRAYIPFWPRGEVKFLLVEGSRVYQFDPDSLHASPLSAEDWDVLSSRDLSVSPRGSYAAYVGLEDGQEQLYRVNFKSQQTQRLLPPHVREKHAKDWWYILGRGFRSMLEG